MSDSVERLRVTLQKDGGRMSDGSKLLLTEAGFKVAPQTRVDFVDDPRFPLRVRYIKNGGIGTDLMSDLSDLGILGLDMAEEADPNIIRVSPLGFGGCSLYLGVRNGFTYNSPQDLDGQRIATSYIAQARKFAERNNISPIIVERSGGEESLVNEESAEACIVISESGDTFLFNQVTAREKLLDSEAYLVASPTLKEEKGKERIVEQFLRRIVSVLRGRQFTILEMNVPQKAFEEVVKRLPSEESPTVTRLEEKGWFSVSSVVPVGQLWEVVSTLQEAGARDIIETELKKVMPNLDDSGIMEMMGKIYG